MPWDHIAESQADRKSSIINAILNVEITPIEGKSDEFNDLMTRCMSK